MKTSSVCLLAALSAVLLSCSLRVTISEGFVSPELLEAKCRYYRTWIEDNECEPPPNENPGEADEADEEDEEEAGYTFAEFAGPEGSLIDAVPLSGGASFAGSVEDCEGLCEDNTKCGAYAFYTSGDPPDGNNCVLMPFEPTYATVEAGGATVVQKIKVQAVKNDETAVPEFHFTDLDVPTDRLIDVAPLGGLAGVSETPTGYDSVGVHSAGTRSDCEALCAGNYECGAYTFYTSGGFSTTGKNCKLMPFETEYATVEGDGVEAVHGVKIMDAAEEAGEAGSEDDGSVNVNDKVYLCGPDDIVDAVFEGVAPTPLQGGFMDTYKFSSGNTIYHFDNTNDIRVGSALKLYAVHDGTEFSETDGTYTVVSSPAGCVTEDKRITFGSTVYRCVPGYAPQKCDYIGKNASDGEWIHKFSSYLWAQVVTYHYKGGDEPHYDKEMTLVRQEAEGYGPVESRNGQDDEVHVFRESNDCGPNGGTVPPENIEDDRPQREVRKPDTLFVEIPTASATFNAKEMSYKLPMFPVLPQFPYLVDSITVIDSPYKMSSLARTMRVKIGMHDLQILREKNLVYVVINGKYRIFRVLNDGSVEVFSRRTNDDNRVVVEWSSEAGISCDDDDIDACVEDVSALPETRYPLITISETSTA